MACPREHHRVELDVARLAQLTRMIVVSADVPLKERAVVAACSDASEPLNAGLRVWVTVTPSRRPALAGKGVCCRSDKGVYWQLFAHLSALSVNGAAVSSSAARIAA